MFGLFFFVCSITARLQSQNARLSQQSLMMSKLLSSSLIHQETYLKHEKSRGIFGIVMYKSTAAMMKNRYYWLLLINFEQIYHLEWCSWSREYIYLVFLISWTKVKTWKWGWYPHKFQIWHMSGSLIYTAGFLSTKKFMGKMSLDPIHCSLLN